MIEIEKFLTTGEITVVQAMQKIDANAKGIIFVVDKKGKLTGCISDGNIRRWIIQTGNLTSSIEKIQNRRVRFLFEGEVDSAQSYMQSEKINCLPIVNTDMVPVDICFAGDQSDHLRKNSLRDIPVVIMAGGKGTRLYPYTKILPKPLIPIGDIPIIERIMDRFYSYGVGNFYVTVNYKKEMIKSYFAELKPPYKIHYIEETKPLGTAGSIKLIREKFEKPVIITNCDILIEADYEKVLQYHESSGNDLTIISSLKNVTIPYGVLHTKEQGIITSMEEKPQLSYFINTGMYYINPELIDEIPDDTFFHMTDLSEKLMNKKKRVGMYPISENSYLDMGQIEEMKKMEDRINSGEVK